jgi:hypothetical protein
MRRFLIASGFMLAVMVTTCGAMLTQFFHALTRAPDPYPAFMAGSQPRDTRSYQQAMHLFSESVVRTFPIGSNAKDAIAQITSEGFRVARSTPESVELLWNRSAGPCSEQYLIMIDQNADGAIAKTTGRLHPICL